MFDRLKNYKDNNGDCLVPSKYKCPDGSGLYAWVAMQRQRNGEYRSGKMVTATREGRRDNIKVWESRFERLKSLDFCFDAHEAEWNEQFEALARYRAVWQHCNVGQGLEVALNDKNKLARWAQTQRAQYMAYRKGEKSSMAEEKIQQLEQLGFKWTLKTNSDSSASSTSATKKKTRSSKTSKQGTSRKKATSSSARVSTRSTDNSKSASSHQVKKRAARTGSKSKVKKSKVRRDPTTDKVIIDRTRSQNYLRASTNRFNRENNAK